MNQVTFAAKWLDPIAFLGMNEGGGSSEQSKVAKFVRVLFCNLSVDRLDPRAAFILIGKSQILAQEFRHGTLGN